MKPIMYIAASAAFFLANLGHASDSSILSAVAPLSLADGIRVAQVQPVSASSETATQGQSGNPLVISMPKGSVPEGIAIKGSQAFITSLSDGTLYKVDLLNGKYDILHPATGTSAAGIMLDGQGRLFVAGGWSGSVQVIDPDTGKKLADYKLTDSKETFVNDFTRLGNAIYVTESYSPTLYKLPMGEGDKLPEQQNIETISLAGITHGEGWNSNGIAATPDGKALLIVQTNTGLLFRVNASSGVAAPVDIGDADLSGADGLLREGNTLYVVRNMPNTIAVLELNDAGTTAKLKKELKDVHFDTPTAVARFNDTLYVTNARFTVGEAATADFTVSGVLYRP